jgi:eukaryotic-like serine/threonine-protein kinase
MLGDSLRRRHGGRPAASADPVTPGPTPPRRPFPWRPLLIALPLVLGVFFLLGYLVATRLLFPPPEATGAGIAVPDLLGRSATEARQALVAAGLGELQPTELPHPSAPSGQVVAQSPLPGQQLRRGEAVRVALSAGRPRALVPDVHGFSADRAEVMLRRSGFATERIPEESAAAAGRVIRTEPAPGEERVLPSSVTLFVSTGPPAAPDTIPADTIAPPPPS